MFLLDSMAGDHMGSPLQIRGVFVILVGATPRGRPPLSFGSTVQSSWCVLMVLCFGYLRWNYGMSLLDSAAGDHMGSPLRVWGVLAISWGRRCVIARFPEVAM